MLSVTQQQPQTVHGRVQSSYNGMAALGQFDGGRIRKRKAEADDLNAQFQRNERLSRRLSELSLGHQGKKRCLPTPSTSLRNNATPPSSVQTQPVQTHPRPKPKLIAKQVADDHMQVDATPHKIYISNIDDELSSSDGESSSDESLKIRFHPSLREHFNSKTKNPLDPANFTPAIPPQVRVNAEGEIGGVNLNHELVLYGVPSSLTVSEDRDSVRKAIIEARQRARAAQGMVSEAIKAKSEMGDAEPYIMDGYAEAAKVEPPTAIDEPIMDADEASIAVEDDADAMDID